MPDYTVDTMDGTITFTSMTKIVFKVGDNSITLDAKGITVKGMSITEKSELSHAIETVQGEFKAPGGLNLKASQLKVTPG